MVHKCRPAHFGSGKGGNITINTSRNFEMIGDGEVFGRILPSRLVASVEEGSKGGGGDITINTQNLVLKDGVQIGTTTFGEGNGGTLNITATDSIQLSGTSSDGFSLSSLNASAQTGSRGNAGNLIVNTPYLLVRDGARVRSSTFGSGKGGNLTVNASDKVEVIGISANGLFPSGIFASSQPGQTGDAGNLTIHTQDLLVRDGAQVNASTFGRGKGGNLTVNAGNSVKIIGTSVDGRIVSGLFARTEPGATGDAGNLTIYTQDLLVQDEARITTSKLSGGMGGDLVINTKDLLALNGGQINTSTASTGKGGNLTINASGKVQVIGVSVYENSSNLLTSALNRSTGNAGDLTITAQDLLVRDGGRIDASTSGAGKGGNLIVKAGNIQLIGASPDDFGSGLFTSAQSNSTGDAGDLTITTQDLIVRDGALVSASTFGTGKGGNLTINASNKVELIGRSDGLFPDGLFAQASNQKLARDGGDLTINTQDLIVRNGSVVSTGTFGGGNGGNLTVNATKSVQLIGTAANGRDASRLLAQANQGSTGDGGDLTINTQDLIVQDGAGVSTATRGSGKGGNLTINASNSVQVIGTSNNKVQILSTGDESRRLQSGLSSSAVRSSTGDAGDLTINTQNLLVRDGAQVGAATFGTGKAGNLTVNASNSVQLIGESADGQYISGLFASTEPRSTGNAGDLTINTQDLLVRDRAGVFVNSQGTGNAGIMTINADTINLDNNATLSANTRSPNKDPNREQATINLNTQNLTLRHGSNITTNATGENVFGGNINIYTKFLIAVENSRISANSDNSRGGRVVVNARGVFVGNQPSDVAKYITATSGVGLSGSVEVNAPDNSSILNSFAEVFPAIDTNALIAQSCIARGDKRQENSFTITGSGALNPNRPGGILSNYTTGEVRGVELSRPWKKGDPIIEATGVYHLSNGQILLSRECSN